MQDSVPKTTESPQSIEAEAQILGSILIEPEVALQVMKTLRQYHFHDERHILIYRGMIQIVESGGHVSAVTVADWERQQNVYERSGGSEYLMRLMDAIATTNPAQIDNYCRIIGDRYLQRSLIDFGKELINYGLTTSNPHELIKVSTEALARLNGSVGGGDQRIVASAIRGDHLLEKDVTKPPSIIGDGVLTESSFMLLYGKPGLGKTWLALQMAFAVARGKPWLGIPTQKRRVGIIEMEMHEYYLRERLMELMSLMDADEAREALANIEIIIRPNYKGTIDLMEPATRDGITNWVGGKGIKMLVLDAMSRMHCAAENNAQDMGQVLGNIERIKDETSAGVVGIHHEPKESSGGKEKEVSDMDAARGSSRFQSDPHTMIRLKLWKGRHVLMFAKMNLGPTLEPIFLNRMPQGHFIAGETPLDGDAIRARNEAKIEDFLLSVGESGATTKTVGSEMHLSPRTAKKYLDDVGTRVGNVYYHKSFDMQLQLNEEPERQFQSNTQEAPSGTSPEPPYPDDPDEESPEPQDEPLFP